MPDSLLEDRFAPATSQVGFIEADLRGVATALTSWRRRLAATGEATRALGIDETFPEVLAHLAPLTVARHARELLAPTRSAWTAYFDSGHQGTDWAAPSYIAKVLGVRFVWVSCIPQTGRRFGSVQLWVHGPDGDGPLQGIRSVAAVNDGGRWTWDAVGTPQPFEESEMYTARRVRDRFTSEMLERYCGALGIRYFDPDFYGPGAWLVEDTRPDWAPFSSRDWSDVRDDLGLDPVVG